MQIDYIFQESGVYDYFINSHLSKEKLRLPWMNKVVLRGSDAAAAAGGKEESRRRRQEVREEYFRQISKAEVRELYQKYKTDHLLFGYSPEDFVKMAQ